MKLTAIAGNSQMLDGGAMFGNAPKALWQRWIEPDADNRVPLACRTLLVELGDGRNILFETGIGCFFEPSLKDRYGVQEDEHKLLTGLAKLGLSDTDIDAVVLSHMHFDHAGGLLSAWSAEHPPQLLFPNAQYWVGRRHWERAQQPHPRDRASFLPDLNQQLLDSGRLHLIDDDGQHNLGDWLSVRFSEGHTPGLMLSILETHVGPVAFSSDLIPGAAWSHLPITMGYDRYPEQLIDEKQDLQSWLLERQGWLFFTHDANLACGRVQRSDKGRYSAVAEPQNSPINREIA